jgi:LSD1 subclass zinc finger protein
MLVVCPSCQKKLNVPDNAAGKKVRCPVCKNVVPVTAPTDAVAEAPVAPQRPAPAAPAKARREAVRAGAPKPPPPDEDADSNGADIRCAACEAATVEELPTNKMSRHPGYTCTSCGAVMRPPGSSGTYIFVIVLGGLIVVLGAGLAVAVFTAPEFRARSLTGAVGVAGMGIAAAVWAVTQLRLPIPLNAPTRPSRLGLWIGIAVAAILVIGAAWFGFEWFLQQM